MAAKAASVLFLASAALASPIHQRNASTCTSPVQRKNYTSLSNDEKLAWIKAEQCLTTHDAVFGLFDAATTLWDEQQFNHLTQSNFIHGVGQFLPWHRYYMTLHEKLLQTYCGYEGGMPYWDEQADAENITQSAIWDDVYGIGGDGASNNSNIVTSGPFAYMELHVGANADNSVVPKDAGTYYLNRSISVTTFQNAEQQYVDECLAIDNYTDVWSCYGQSPHSAGHAGTGGTMQDPVLSPGDPVFFLHHTNLDRLWWQWQSANLTARLTDMGGNNVPSDEFNAANNWDAPGANWTDYSGDPGNVTTLDHVLTMFGMLPNVTVGDVMDIGGDVICAEYV
ncbi:hypothetical protein GGR56DRAFT_673936 [Xylariaceae sp. FL0804]|nr:hypothetical protein GGR56DRAFT_673936 [Xylariaceae sp. FL0804]